MGSPILHVGAQAMCPHGGQVTVVPSSPRVTVGGQVVATVGDQFLVAGCAFTVPPSKPQPCMTLRWLQPALRVKVGGQPVITQSSTGLALSADQIPAGPPTVVQTQLRASAT